MFRRKTWSVVSVLFVVNFIGVGGALAAENEISPMTEEGEEAAELRYDILSRRSDALMEGFFESFKQSEKGVFDKLPEEISNEIFRLGKVLDMEVIDWLDYFTKWIALPDSMPTLYHHGEDTTSDEWIQNETKMNVDFSKFVGVLLYILENAAEGPLKEGVNNYLRQLCQLLTNESNEVMLLRKFSLLLAYASFAKNVLNGTQIIIPEIAKAKNKSVVYSIPAAVMQGQNRRDTLWNPRSSDYSADDVTDFKFLVMSRLLITIRKFGSAENQEKALDVLRLAKLANEEMVSTMSTKVNYDMPTLYGEETEVGKFFTTRSLIIGYCLDRTE